MTLKFYLIESSICWYIFFYHDYCFVVECIGYRRSNHIEHLRVAAEQLDYCNPEFPHNLYRCLSIE